VAGELSSAFTGCSGFGDILRGLEGRSDTAPVIKPQAIKKRKFVAKAKKAAVAKAKKAAVPKAGAVPKPAAKAAVPKPAAVAAVGVAGAVPEPAAPVAKAVVPEPAAKAPVPKAPEGALSDTRKCVHSRAYKYAARVAKAAGKNPAEISAAACKAGKEANAKWDLEHPE